MGTLYPQTLKSIFGDTPVRLKMLDVLTLEGANHAKSRVQSPAGAAGAATPHGYWKVNTVDLENKNK